MRIALHAMPRFAAAVWITVVVAATACGSPAEPAEPAEPLVAPGTFSVVFTGAISDSISGWAVFGPSDAKVFLQMEGPATPATYQLFVLNIPPGLAPGEYSMSGIPAADGTVPDAYMILNGGLGQLRSRSGRLTVLRTGPTQLAGRAVVDVAAEPAFSLHPTRVSLRFNATCGELYRCP